MQLSPSSQAPATNSKKQNPVSGSQLSVVHPLLSLHEVSVIIAQRPTVQRLTIVQVLLSSQGSPSSAISGMQSPDSTSHTSTVHGLPSSSSHSFALPVMISHLGSANEVLQKWDSVQELSSSEFSQSESKMHSQVLIPPSHTPFWQIPIAVHGFPSSHTPVKSECLHPASASHSSKVQGSLSSQGRAFWNPEHVPSLQKSPRVHVLPSLQ